MKIQKPLRARLQFHLREIEKRRKDLLGEKQEKVRLDYKDPSLREKRKGRKRIERKSVTRVQPANQEKR